MDKEKIFMSLFEQFYYELGKLEREMENVADVDVVVAKGYGMALGDMRDVLEKLEWMKNKYLSGE